MRQAAYNVERNDVYEVSQRYVYMYSYDSGVKIEGPDLD